MKIKIIAGSCRGRNLQVPDNDPAVRPSKSIVREAGMNMVTSRLHLPDCTVIDLFAGCGALGIEALSRGAAHVTFVDINTTYVRQNLQALPFPPSSYHLVQQDVTLFVPQQKAQLVLADPPYKQNMLPDLLKRKDIFANKESLWLLESESFLQLAVEEAGFEVLKERKFGTSKLWLLRQL